MKNKVDYPCGIKITYQDADMCATARGALGNVGQDAINKAGAMCECIPEITKLVTKDSSKSVMDGASTGNIANELIPVFMRLQQVRNSMLCKPAVILLTIGIHP